MFKRRSLTKIAFLTLFTLGLVVFAFAFASSVSAQTDTFGVKPVSESIGLAGGDIRTIAARIIRAILGILGVVAVAIVLYGGFVYMTAAGNEDKVATAKKILINGTIGLGIILAAFSITQFVLHQLQSAINPEAGEVTASEPPPSVCDVTSSDYNPEQCSALCKLHPDYSVCKDAAFYVKSITPSTPGAGNATGMNNITIRVLFSQPLSPTTDLAKAVSLVKTGAETALPLSVALVENGRALEAVYGNDAKTVPPLASGESYIVAVNKDVKNITGKDLIADYSFGGAQYGTSATFVAEKEFKDTVPPIVKPLTLNGSGGNGLTLKLGDIYTVATEVSDKSASAPFGGVGLVKLSLIDTADGKVVLDSYDGPAVKTGSSPAFSFTYKNVVASSLFTPLHTYLFMVTGYDIDGNDDTQTVKFTVYGAHCGNGKQDGDETGVDTGGSCGGGEGASCKKTADCAAGFACVANKCAASPYIEDVDPMDGASGNWITVLGKNFGTKVGKVEFASDLNGNNSLDADEWVTAGVVQCDGTPSWNANYVVVQVPAAASGSGASAAKGILEKSAIRVAQGDNPALFDTTVNDFGPKPGGEGLFVKNDTKRPGLCKVGVADNFDNIKIGDKSVSLLKGATAAPPKVPVKAIGSGFGEAKGTSNIFFGGIIGAVKGSGWFDTSILTEVPGNLQPGDVGVYVAIGNEKSNGVKFKVLSDKDLEAVPQVGGIDPAATTPKSFITISGKGFGEAVGQVFVADSPGHVASCGGANADGSCAALNVTSLPGACGDTWRDTEIIADLPEGTAAGVKFLRVKNTLGLASDGQASFQVVSGAPRPSICRIDPNQGPAPLPKGHTGLTIAGVNFGSSPAVFYWGSGAKPEDPNTWLKSDEDFVNGASPVLKFSDTEITTLLPISVNNGLSMSTGPIKVQSNTGAYSNGVNYTVTSCVGAGELPGYQCCAAGSDKGFWKKKEYQCAGEVREAGYVWRFGSGLIPDLPEVIDSCKEGEFPSPTPRKKSGVATAACLNASVAVRFSLPMDETSFSSGGVKIFACGEGAGGAIDCSASKKDVTDEKLFAYESGVLKIREYPDAPLLTTSTWYHVELSTKVTSHQTKIELGQSKTVKQSLVATKPCGSGSAYCFDFKTGTGLCTLVNAYINPPSYTTGKLGVLEDPGWLGVSEVALWPEKPANPFYYYVWGAANQECIALNVDQYGWQWSPAPGQAQSDLARAYKDPGNGYTHSRAVVEARAHTAPDSVAIKAAADVPNDQGTVKFSPTSTLVIDLADPAVLYYEPSCVEACVNTAIRVKFNRQMSSSTFASGFKLYECLDNSTECGQKSEVTPLYTVEPDSESPADSLLASLLAQEKTLKPDQYYQIVLNEKGTPAGSLIKALTKVDPIFYGAVLPETKLPFKTRKSAALCLPATVKVTPHPYTASVVGQRQAFSAQPYSSPDSCSKFGQPLSKWSFAYGWSANENPGVAKVVSNFNTGYGFKSFCGVSCLPKGSQVASDSSQKNEPLCGNGVVEAGEDCEVGEAGCTLRCLFATQKSGSGPAPTDGKLEVGKSYCGDGVVTAGEACDTAKDKGCTANCLHTGTPLAAYWCENKATAEQKKSTECLASVSICGNGLIDPGEECEIGKDGATSETCDTRCLVKNACGASLAQCLAGTPGCKKDCTYAGASLVYTPPSLCGDGAVGVGENPQCENLAAGAAALAGGPTQLVEAVGEGKATVSGLQQTKVRAELQSKVTLTGAADYSLQCGYTEYKEKTGGVFNDCPANADNILGVAKNSCCRLRPMRESELPLSGSGFGGPGVCRNAYIEAVFPVKNTGSATTTIDNVSLTNNVILLHGYSGQVNCLEKGGVAADKTVVGQFLQIQEEPAGGFVGRVWSRFKQFFSRLFGGAAGAGAVTDAIKAAGIDTWCAGEVSASAVGETVQEGSDYKTHVRVKLSDLLAPGSIYGVLLKGGPNGISDTSGAGIGSPDYKGLRDDIWWFKTGDDVCKLQSISVSPSAQLFGKPKEQHTFLATMKSTNGQAIQPTVGYSWTLEWKPSSHPVFEIPALGAPNHEDSVLISAREVQGEAKGVLEAKVTADTTSKDNQLGKVFTANFDLVALFCSNPWPALPQYPFKDDKYNFSMSYCADAGAPDSKLDDLPYLEKPLIFLKSDTELAKKCSVLGSACASNADCDLSLYQIPELGTVKVPGGTGLCLYPDSKPYSPAGVSAFCSETKNCLSAQTVSGIVNEDGYGVTVDSGRAYVATGSGLVIFDVNNPLNPTKLGSVKLPGSAHYSTVIFGNYAFVASHEAGIQVVDVSNPAVPTVAASVKPTPVVLDIALAGSFVSVADGEKGMALVDMSQPLKPTVLGSLSVGGPTTDIAHFSTYVAVAGPGSMGYLINTANPLSPKLIGTFQVGGIISDLTMTPAHIIVSSIGNGGGVYVVRQDLLGSPIQVENVPQTQGVARDGNTVYGWSGAGTVYRIDIANPLLPNLKKTYTVPDVKSFTGLVAGGERLYAANITGGKYPALTVYSTGASDDAVSCVKSFSDSWKNSCKPIGAELVTPDVLSADTLKRYLFFNPQNEDVVGVQIFKNDKASLTEWYLDKFETLGSLKSTSVAGYEALTDGNNYYVNATNYVPGPTPAADTMYNNVYLFSINPNAQQPTREVFTKLLASLAFNINLTDHGYCLKGGVVGFDNSGKTAVRTAPDQYGDTKCTTDFDCRDAAGTPSAGTNGFCSNAKTKLFRDLDRLGDIGQALGKLDSYFAQTKATASFKGDLKSGTFAPGYTVSRWPSWGLLGGLVGGLQVDPLNRWTSCAAGDQQTCWDSEKTLYACPKFKSVYEYEFVSSTGSYVFHAPLEFFVKSDQLVGAKLSDADLANYSAEPWLGCTGDAYNPFGEKCGDGVLNPGEQCEPPGQAVISGSGQIPAEPGKCETWPAKKCASDLVDCGFSKKDGNVRLHSSRTQACVNELGRYVINLDKSDTAGGHYTLFGCGSDSECRSASAYKDIHKFQIGTASPPTQYDGASFAGYFNQQGQKFSCQQLVSPDLAPDECDGIVSAGIGACPAGSLAQKSCANSCQWSYGLCQSTAKCGNGVAETGESCDDGAALNGSYGQCGLDCKSLSPQYCGNKALDYNDKNKNNKVDAGEALEFCEPGVGDFAAGNYAVKKENSCAWDCQGFGAYCGDKVLQSDKGEECDDGNTAEKDGCTSTCQLDGLVCKAAGPEVSVFGSGNNTQTRIEVVKDGQPVSACVDQLTISEVCAGYNLPCISLLQKINNPVIEVKTLLCTDAKANSPIKDLLVKDLPDPTVLDATVICQGQSVAPAADLSGPGKCGNGIVEPNTGDPAKNEVCDLGSENGQACAPSYGKSCAYCSVDCKKVLTVDPVAFCGNSKIDQTGIGPDGLPQYEQCDTSGVEILEAQADGSGKAVSCAPLKGSYQCLNGCTELKNQCVDCGFFENKPKTTLALVNPMHWEPFSYFNVLELLDTVNYSRTSKNDDGTVKGLTFLKSTNVPTVSDGTGIETSPLCNGNYTVMFNSKKLVGGNIATPFDALKADKADVFDFPVGGEAVQVTRPLVYSPAVPKGTFRVVVKWTAAEASQGAEFQGLVYSEDMSYATKPEGDKSADAVSYLEQKNEKKNICNSLEPKGWGLSASPSYWRPAAIAPYKCLPEFSVYTHDMEGDDAKLLKIQSFTIDTSGLSSSAIIPTAPDKPYAFFVQSIDNLIWGYRFSNLEVEIYGYHDGQNPLYSVYEPIKVFKIKNAAGTSSNPLVKYWHVFNLVKENGAYQIKPVVDTDPSSGQKTEQSDGTLETNFCQVLVNIPDATQCAL